MYCEQHAKYKTIYDTDQLRIHSITDQIFVHETYLQTESFGKVACNGMIYMSKGEAVIFDTPADTVATRELIDVVAERLGASVKVVVPTHFHGDCLGGLGLVHELGIASLANQLTIKLAEKAGESVPLIGFDQELTLPVGHEEVQLKFFGEGHTRDNIIAYIPSANIMFGGCLIKKVGASRGYTGDANLTEWSNTVEKIKSEFPNLQVVVPGHGAWGGQELLDYTIKLFSEG